MRLLFRTIDPMPLVLVAGLFLLVAAAYASVGFGGGSSYNAILVLAGTEYRAIPAIALTCNILVVSGGVYHFSRAGHFRFSDMLPFVALSVPFAWWGGSLEVQETTFTGLLGLALLLTALQMFWKHEGATELRLLNQRNPWMIGLPLGASIGFLSGMVGVGGGIFLAPVLYLAGWGKTRHIAAIASGFILVNSMAGLAGQLMKQGSYSPASEWLASWPLFMAVLVGGQLGSRLASRGLSETWIQRFTGVLILYVAVRLLLKWSSLTGLL